MELKMYSVADLTKILNLHPKTILRFIKEGKIKARKIGRSWMVNENELKEYCHGELAGKDIPKQTPDYETLKDRIHVSTVVEINEQNSEEASRLSNSLMAMLNSEKELNEYCRFDFFYYPEIEKAKYVFYGSPQVIGRIIDTFATLSNQR